MRFQHGEVEERRGPRRRDGGRMVYAHFQLCECSRDGGRWANCCRAVGAAPRHRAAVKSSCSAMGRTLPPEWAWGSERSAKEDHSQALRFNIFPLGSGLSWDLTLLPSCLFLLLEWECLPHAFPTVVFWKHTTCLVSQVHSWRRICLSESYLESHPYLI